MIFVSIIIPSFNRASLIAATVNSCLQQTYKNIEIIVVDDGSSDNTKQILEEYIKENKIVYQWQPNKGRSEARNNGAMIAGGQYLLFLDSDDLLMPTAIEYLYQLTKNNVGSAIFGGRTGLFLGDDINTPAAVNELNYHTSFHNKQLISEVAGDFFLSIGSFIVQKEAFSNSGKFLKKFEPAEDLDLSIKLLLNNRITWSSEFEVVRKRRHESNTDDSELYKAAALICNYYIDKIKQGKLLSGDKDKSLLISNLYERLSSSQLHINNKFYALKSFARMIRYDSKKFFSYKKYHSFAYFFFRKQVKKPS